MGRSPCCDKIGLKKGPWTHEEDQKLLAYIEEHGHGSWRTLPAKAGLQRCGKSCRLRWSNYLRPDIKRGKFSLQEEQTIIQLHALLGNRWSAIATHLPKRTDNEIKNYWNTHLTKRLAKMGIDPVTHKPKKGALLSCEGQPKNTANLSHMAQWESARLEAEARLVRQSNLRSASANSLQTPQSASTFGPPQKPVGPARFLGVLKASSVSAAAIGYDLESPTSTLSSTAGIGVGDDGGTMKEDTEEEWKLLPEFKDGIGSSSIFRAECVSESVKMNSIERVNFGEKFTNLLLSTSSNHQLTEYCGGESDNGGGTIGGGDCCEDNKNYWSSILNLVDSPPSPIL